MWLQFMQGMDGSHLREVLYMKQKVKLKGHLKAYLQTTLILGILLIFVNVGVYFLDIMAGICVSGFLLVYLVAMLTLLYRNRPVIMNEFINFATQYGQIQRTLLWDLELPHVLMDDDGRIIWMNAAFERVIHKASRLPRYLLRSRRTSWNLSRIRKWRSPMRGMSMSSG